MKRFFSFIASIILILMICIQITNACTFAEESLQKSFRQAKAVFLGEVKDIKLKPNSDYIKSLIDGEITFVISKSWKGNYKKQITFPANIGWACGCDSPDQFKVGQEYIVFIDKQSVANFCDSEKADTKYGRDKVKRLDNFWFRNWAQIYPF